MHDLFDYVLFHFKRIYDLPGPLEMSYGLDGKSRVQIKAAEPGFFEQENPYPATVSWKQWEGTSLPLFFDNETELDWVSVQDKGQVVLNYDLIAGCFYLLSGWQEYYSSIRDRFGRFPFSASVQAKLGFVSKPIVNYYFDVLRVAVEKAYGQPITLKNWNGKTFATCLTHDMDYIQSAWKVAGKPALQKGHFKVFLHLAFRKMLGKDAWFNLPEVVKELKKLNAPATFFFLPESKKAGGYPNADYDVTSAKLQKEISLLTAAGHEVGVHGSHGSGTHVRQLKNEKEKITSSVKGNRFHYLRFDSNHSVSVLEASDLEYDSSLGFAEHFGFRNSYCHPFRLYDFIERRMSSVWEVPLNLMDISLNHPHYLQLSPAEVMPAIKPMLEEIIRFHGLFTLLWHNENFSEYGMAGGLEMFQEITSFLQKEGTCFLTGTGPLAAHQP